jgi:hypothetical protein
MRGSIVLCSLTCDNPDVCLAPVPCGGVPQATRPDDVATKEKHVARILQSVDSFPAIRAAYKCEPTKVLVSKVRAVVAALVCCRERSDGGGVMTR